MTHITINDILGKYGDPPREAESWATAYEKILTCLLAMEAEIEKLRKALENNDK